MSHAQLLRLGLSFHLLEVREFADALMSEDVTPAYAR
jgi:hypothetical protein